MTPKSVPIVNPYQAEISRILEVRVDGRNVEPITADQLRYELQRDGQPHRYTQLKKDELTFYPTPAAGDITMRVTLIPRRGAETLPDILYDRYLEQIAAGALARLHSVDAPWAKKDMVGFYSEAFNMAIAETAARTQLNNIRARLNVRPNFV